MWECPKCRESIEDGFDICWSCGTSRDGTGDPDFESQIDASVGDDFSQPSSYIPDGMILATTRSLESHGVQKYLGLVFGEAIVGANVFRDLFASITDVVGGRSGAYESALADARRIAIGELAQRAGKLGANAVLGIDFDYETIRGSMLMVTCSGTAVVVFARQIGTPTHQGDITIR